MSVTLSEGEGLGGGRGRTERRAATVGEAYRITG